MRRNRKKRQAPNTERRSRLAWIGDAATEVIELVIDMLRSLR